jgi:hypothetical protein
VQAGLSSTDQGNRGLGKPEQNQCGRILGTHSGTAGGSEVVLIIVRVSRWRRR